MHNSDLGTIVNVDAKSVTKEWHGGEFFNIFNRPVFLDPDVAVADAGFGGIRAANDQRIIQLAAKSFV